jgi:hypothetical protein
VFLLGVVMLIFQTQSKATFFIGFGLIYFFWKAGKGGKCPICGGKDWGKPE